LRTKDYISLSKVISHALRHDPLYYNLQLKDKGWIDIDILLRSISKRVPEFSYVTKGHLLEMINESKKRRHEIQDNSIRATYGHSLPGKFVENHEIPPEFLFHGTTSDSLKGILDYGLLPMKRQYVHMSETIEEAMQVAKRKSLRIELLRINSMNAYTGNVKFYKVGIVWLTDFIPPKYIEKYDKGS
jgi:putative RNA 2'-phosphotransferase